MNPTCPVCHAPGRVVYACHHGQTTDARKPLSQRQELLLGFVKGYVAKHGYAPTVREIADALEISSTNAVTDHLKALERKGYVKLTKGAARAIVVVP